MSTETDDTKAKQNRRLQFKSPENTPGQPSESGAVLCTLDKTYSLRQVNTSNSLYVAQLSQGPADELPNPRLEAIAQAHFTLELTAAKDVATATHIRALLPVYASTGHYQSRNPVSQASLFSNIPASDRECERAWRELACFELDGEALRPSESVKVLAWESMFTAATADGIDLTCPLQEKHVATLVDLNGSQWPREVSLAVLQSMAQPDGAENVVLDAQKCARVIGHALLKDRTDKAAMSKAAFTSAWADLLPEKWRSSADLGLLEGSYKIEAGNITFSDGEAAGADAMAAGTKAPAEAKSALGAKRKWHDKFRAAKKTA